MSLWIPPWLEKAFSELGTEEVAGQESNPRIKQYLETVGVHDGDETSWCSAFVNWVMTRSGFQGTNKPNARSWMQWGTRIENPSYGCIVVLWRDNPQSWTGHVGFYMGSANSFHYLLGGNQRNMVSIEKFPSNRVLGYRIPSTAMLSGQLSDPGLDPVRS